MADKTLSDLGEDLAQEPGSGEAGEPLEGDLSLGQDGSPGLSGIDLEGIAAQANSLAEMSGDLSDVSAMLGSDAGAALNETEASLSAPPSDLTSEDQLGLSSVPDGSGSGTSPETQGGASPGSEGSAAADSGEGGNSDGKRSRLDGLLSVAGKFTTLAQKKKQGWLDSSLVFAGVFSEDRPTRRMSVVFILSLVGFCVVATIAWKKFTRESHDQRLALKVGDAFEEMKQKTQKRLAEERFADSAVTLGKFTLELKPLPGQVPQRGITNMAEVEIVLQCDGVETKQFIERNMIRVRNELSTVLTSMDREELLSREGKKRWKSILLRQINSWMPKEVGKVDDLFFSRLIIN